MEPFNQIGSFATPALQLSQVAKVVVLGLGLAWASGISLYMAMMVLGFVAMTGMEELPPGLSLFENPMMMLLAVTMYIVQLIAVRVPESDTGWDFIHSIIYIAAGALFAAAAVSPAGQADPMAAVFAGLIGGWLAYISHASRLGAASHLHLFADVYPQWMLIVGRDAMVIAGLWTAFHFPLVFMLLLIIFVLFSLLSDHPI